VSSIGARHHKVRAVYKGGESYCAARHWWGGCKRYEFSSTRLRDYSEAGGHARYWFDSNSYEAHVALYTADMWAGAAGNTSWH